MSTTPEFQPPADLQIGDQPPNTTIAITNIDSGNIIDLSGSENTGNLWLAYEYGDQPATNFYIWQPRGGTITVSPGIATYRVGPDAMLVYEPVNQTDSFKIGWAFV
jgi:hypothetical protein